MDQAVHEVRLSKWIGIIQEAASSGMTKVAWCEQHGIRRRQFYYWQKRLQEYVVQQMSKDPGAMRSSVEEKGISVVTEKQPKLFCEIEALGQEAHGMSGEDSLDRFSVEMAIQAGGYNILIGSNVTERALRTVLAVIGHA